MVEAARWFDAVLQASATPGLIPPVAAFLVLVLLQSAAMGAVLFAPGWFCVRAFGWPRGLAIYGPLLSTAHRMTTH